MLTSLALIILLGLTLGSIFKRLKLPSLIGMIITGIILSPYAFNLLDQSILNMSSQLRQVALVIILTRAGLSLDLKDLKKVGRPAILMCFLPACFEILAVILIAPKLLGVSLLEAAIMGSVIAAVSPAVIVPRMIKLYEEGYGKAKCIPQLILAGASVDDIFVIVLFTSFISLANGQTVSAISFIQIPISIITGSLMGIIVGLILIKFFKIFSMRNTIQVLITLSISFLLITLESTLKGIIPMSGLLAIMSLGITIAKINNKLAVKLASKYNKLWLGAEIFLFVLVGATVDLQYAFKFGLSAILIVIGALLIRMLGVWFSLLKTKLSNKEKTFCMIAYIPKATVQAAIGGIPLSMGLACGQQVLTVAVLSILITAPLGALLIDINYKKLLDKV